jgi:hypothetical protein
MVLAASASACIAAESAKLNPDTSIVRCRAPPDSCTLISALNCSTEVRSASP